MPKNDDLKQPNLRAVYDEALVEKSHDPNTKMMSECQQAGLQAVFEAGRDYERDLTARDPFTAGQLRRYRGVYNPCPKCRGMGVRQYSSGATWHGGMGTTSVAWDLCDECWGTGDAERKGEDLRLLENDMQHRIMAEAARRLSAAAGCGFDVCHQAISELCKELDRLARGRKARPRCFDNICMSLARALREGIGEPCSQPKR